MITEYMRLKEVFDFRVKNVKITDATSEIFEKIANITASCKLFFLFKKIWLTNDFLIHCLDFSFSIFSFFYMAVALYLYYIDLDFVQKVMHSAEYQRMKAFFSCQRRWHVIERVQIVFFISKMFVIFYCLFPFRFFRVYKNISGTRVTGQNQLIVSIEPVKNSKTRTILESIGAAVSNKICWNYLQYYAKSIANKFLWLWFRKKRLKNQKKYKNKQK